MGALKPTSVYVIIENPSEVKHSKEMPPTSLSAYRIPLEGRSVEDVVKETYASQPYGTRVVAVEDTKVTAFDVGMTLEPVSDIRLA